jgi:hypothetical protein
MKNVPDAPKIGASTFKTERIWRVIATYNEF